MLNAFIAICRDLGQADPGPALLKDLVSVVLRENKQAVLWRRLLFLGSQLPDKIGHLLLPLLCATPILSAFDTIEPAGKLLQALFGTLPSSDRLKDRASNSFPSCSGRRKTTPGSRKRTQSTPGLLSPQCTSVRGSERPLGYSDLVERCSSEHAYVTAA
jgi:hypothetical protein